MAKNTRYRRCRGLVRWFAGCGLTASEERLPVEGYWVEEFALLVTDSKVVMHRGWFRNATLSGDVSSVRLVSFDNVYCSDAFRCFITFQ